MPATFLNAAMILVGCLVGILFRNRISEKLTGVLVHAMGLCTLGIGITSAIQTQDTLCVILCMVVGTAIGETVDIEARLEGLGNTIRSHLVKEGSTSRFTEGFVTASVLYCVGSMAIMGSMEAGINNDWSILLSKGVMDGVISVAFAAVMGIGVACSVVPIILYQGGLTLLFRYIGPVLNPEAIVEMSAIGGTIIMGLAFNLLGLPREKLRVGNMLPAIFLPFAYLPLVNFLANLV